VQKRSRAKRYSAEALKELQRNGGSKTDRARVAATTHDEVEAQIARDPDERDMVVDWSSATSEMPRPKAVLK
jgi:hypothetical protein